MINFVIPGRPVPAARMTQRGKWVKRNAARYLAYKSHVAWVAKQHCKEPLEGPVGIKVVAYWWGGRPGDLDNILKAVQDGMNGIAWYDDSQVVYIQAQRVKDKPERTEIWVWDEKELREKIAGGD